MRVVASYSRTSDRYVIEFGAPSDSVCEVEDTSDDATLWRNEKGIVEIAALARWSASTGRLLLGDNWDRLSSLLTASTEDATLTFEVEPAMGPDDGDASLVRRAPRSDLEAPVGVGDPTLDELLADGVPRAVLGATGDGELQGALVALPDVSGAEDVARPRTARVAWNTRTGEMKVEFSVVSGRRTQMWVRVALGESGDLIALAPPESNAVGLASASTIVPHDGLLGELYIDVTDEPLTIIGTSRYRVRRRAARIESEAATLRGRGKKGEARRFDDAASRLRQSLDDSFETPRKGFGGRRSWWWKAPLALVVVVVSALIGRAWGSDEQRFESVGPDSTEPSEPSDESTMTPAPYTNDGIGVLAYRSDATRFSGNISTSVAARVLSGGGGDEGAVRVEVEVSDRAEFPYAGGLRPLSDLLESECRASLYSSTGSTGGAAALPMSVVVLGSSDRDRAGDLLAATTWDPGLELGRFSGFVPMNASVTEDCLVRQTPDGDRLFVVTRQAFEIQTIDVDLPSDVAYLVVRALLSDGTPIAWTSEEVIEVGSAG